MSTTKAYALFSSISSSTNEEGAQSKYQLAYIEFMRGNLDTSEYYITSVLNHVPTYDFWIAKAFILWSDLYLAREDRYQAKVSLGICD